MVIASILVVSTLIIILTPVLAGQWLMKKKFRADQRSVTNRITWDSGCPGVHNTTSEGIKMTERLVELGAPELPEYCDYAFFSKVEIQNPDPRFDILSDTHADCIAVIYKEKGEKPLIAFYGINTLAKDREAEVLAGAKQAHQNFERKFGNYLARKDFKRFIEDGLSRPNDGLIRLGDEEREWVND